MSEKTLIDRIVLADEQGHLQGKPLEGVTEAISQAITARMSDIPAPAPSVHPVEVIAGGALPTLGDGEQERAFMVTAQVSLPESITWLGAEPTSSFRGLIVLRRVSDGTILGVSRSTSAGGSGETPVAPPTPQPAPAALARPTVTTAAASGGSVRAEWSAVPGADSYEVQVDTGALAAAASTSYTFTPAIASGTVKVRAVRGSERGSWGIAVYTASISQSESAVTDYVTTWSHGGWIETNKSLAQYFKAEGSTVTGWEYPRNSQTWEPVPSSDTAHYKPQGPGNILAAPGVKIENEGEKVIITTAKSMGPDDAIGLDLGNTRMRFKVVDRAGTPTYTCEQYPPIPEADGRFAAGRWDSAPVQDGDKLEILHGPDNYIVGTVIRANGDRTKIYGFKVNDWAATRLIWHGWHWESGFATLFKKAA